MKETLGKQRIILDNIPVDVLLGRAAMLGFVLGFGFYLTADVISPGLI